MPHHGVILQAVHGQVLAVAELLEAAMGHLVGQLLDETQPSQQARTRMLGDLPARVAALNQVAEGFYRRWLELAFG